MTAYEWESGPLRRGSTPSGLISGDDLLNGDGRNCPDQVDKPALAVEPLPFFKDRNSAVSRSVWSVHRGFRGKLHKIKGLATRC